MPGSVVLVSVQFDSIQQHQGTNNEPIEEKEGEREKIRW
jgi:hypothetical protein